MRLGLLVVVVLPTIAIPACVHEERRPVEDPVSNEVRAPRSSAPSRPQYIVADPSSSRGTKVVQLGREGQVGVVVERRRIVVGYGEPRVAAELTPEPLAGAERIPSRFGGGFLFWTKNTLYRAAQFDASLAPVTRLPDAIASVSFGPKTLVVRTSNGERWGISLPKGERAPILPVGVADVQALDDGRALAFTDQGMVLASVDGGEHWADVTVQVKSAPTQISIVEQDLWLFDGSSGAYRLEADGRLSWFDKVPVENRPEPRSKDPRWHGNDPPLRAVFHGGAAVDDSTAIVVDSGDLYRVDVHTGEITSVVRGRLPPDASCEAVPAGGDVLFACMAPSTNGAFVVSHTLTSEPPLIEQTFAPGGMFFASDDGGLCYAGPCGGVAPFQGAPPSVCVRMPGGRWEERDVSGLSADGGVSDVYVARWVPRADGHVVALVVEPSLGIYDPQSQTLQPLSEEVKDVLGRSFSSIKTRLRMRRISPGQTIVDSSWTFAGGGVLRGWQRHGEPFEISEDGRLTRSPWSFDLVFAGALGLGRSSDGRLYQSNDHGASWTEVATPPAGIEAFDLVSCTTAGCDLGAFYRVGWAPRPPRIERRQSTPPPAPEVRRVRGLELTCRPSGPVSSKTIPRSDASPEDFGLGAVRLPVSTDDNDWAYLRNPVQRLIVNPVHEPTGFDDSLSPAYRAMFTGFATTHEGGNVISVLGPNRNALSLRRGFSYVVPFDPSGRIVRTAIAMADVVAAGRRAGMTTDEVLSEDYTEGGTVVPLLPPNPTQPSDVVVHNADYGLLSVVRGERVRVALRPRDNYTSIVSGVVLDAEEVAFLEVDSTGVGKVFKLAGGVMTDLFDVVSTANETYYPANPDALALGPKGELAILRTPSGSDPASALDPAFVVRQAAPPAPLAPWSELKLADDPACKADKDGWRAVIQTVGPWIRLANPELRVVEDAPMFARVRWSAKRVCLEGFEIRLPPASVQPAGGPGTNEPTTFATWLVAKGSTFARVGIAEGVEWRQPLECSVVSTGP